MDRHIESLMEDMFEFTIKTEYHFRDLYGLTFVTRNDITSFQDQLTAAEIQVVGIIYEENDEIYFAPLDEIGKIEPIVKEFVKHCLK